MAKIVDRGDPIEPVYLNNLIVAAHGWGVVSGLTVSQRAAGANMSVDVASGEAWINATKVEKGSTTNVAVTSAHATYDRYDLVVLNSSGTISVIAGTTGATSYANDYDLETNNAILLAEVEIPATDTSIETAQCTDKRIFSFMEERDVVNGIAGLESSGDLLVPGESIRITRNVYNNCHITERTSGETIMYLHRFGANDFKGYINNNSAWSEIQLANMKNVASGIAGLDAATEIPVALLKTNVANGIAGLDASVEIPVSLLKTNVANGVAGLDAFADVPMAQLKTDVASGLASLDSSGQLLIPGHIIYINKDASNNINIRERGSNETAFRLNRNGSDDYDGFIKTAPYIWSQIQTISMKSVPSSATDTGVAGAIAWDSNYIYVCTATNTWKRTAIATW